MSTATETTIEQRLAALETAVAEIRQQLAVLVKPNGLSQVVGITEDYPEFGEVIALGRAFPESRPPPGR